MTRSAADNILAHLAIVASQRGLRTGTPGLDAKVAALKAYQQSRFAHTHGDLLHSARHGPASRFFLEELYGPADFSRRDGQFARVVPALVRLFPAEIVSTVATLSELHALSETLDTAMAINLRDVQLDASEYIRGWQATGRAHDREAQVLLTIDVAKRLDRVTQRALIRNSLRLMRGPARAAGLGELQVFLEKGFDTFRAMGGAADFIANIEAKERSLCALLFGADLLHPETAATRQALAAVP